ncbi:lasso peptide biosynthesis PqqD family chaperone [Metabacillus arenae]|uniref:Lasso peptide biosynthesis PqqD family chaperone n=1 Tax=Metabacillus arenae TaxID=2771434 RepID=A0A926RW60_9BACI|nr:lasso peptide biosynthesis PqqD family chaperone [Metabacillus arenae]MBD1378842.1 lasso peptide biosynthesis PqqD family chaperone [Metabacillus arenae]
MMNKQAIELDSFVVQVDGNIVSDMDGEKVMMSITNSKYYNLGEVGGAIWDIVESPITVNELIVKLMEQYDVEEQECKQQVLSFLEKLCEEEIIQIINKTAHEIS